MKDIVIVGNGGFAKEIRWLIDRINKRSNEWNFLGFVDKCIGDEIIGDDNWFVSYPSEL
jgi:hypothetical protein